MFNCRRMVDTQTLYLIARNTSAPKDKTFFYVAHYRVIFWLFN